jgi:transcription elongation factor GreA
MTFLTVEGYHRLQEELEHLCTVRRREVAGRLREALPEGDVLENGGLQDVVRDQLFLECRIAELRDVLGRAVVIRESGPRERVGLGSTVTVVELAESCPRETYRIVGSVEADPADGRISYACPLGQALIGRRAGEEVVIGAPAGELAFRVVEVE